MGFYSGKKILFGIIAILTFGAILTTVVMWLWNWLLPDLFGLSAITFWQALGLLILSKILFGGWMYKKHHKDHCGEDRNWKQMNPDEQRSMKERFMQKWSQCRYERNEQTEETDNENNHN